MANNKVKLSDGTVLLDLTADTVTADAVIAGRSLHLANGASATGTLEFPVTSVNSKTGAVTLSAADVGALSSGFFYNNAGAHNSIYRGKNLGTAVTDAQYAAIAAGTFDDLYIGDYWVINDITWRIAAFDYYYLTGPIKIQCTTHHVTIVPDKNLISNARMNSSNTTEGGYVSSKMYTDVLEQAKTTIKAAFGEAHIMTHDLYLVNAVTDGAPSGRSWYDSQVELMTEQNVYGCKILSATGTANNMEIDKSQYPLFSHNPYLISNRQMFWLRDVVSATAFACVHSSGYAHYANAMLVSCGVRPAFSIIGQGE